MSLVERLLSSTLAYKIHQAPFAEQKLAPVLAGNDIGSARRVLDLGCGPGTNTPHFHAAEYVGADLDRDYVTDARRRHGRPFVVADATTPFLRGRVFDFILVNSLFHHIDTPGVRRSLSNLRDLLEDGGSIHILDLVLPSRFGAGRALALLDRGDFPRPCDEWEELFTEHFEPVIFEPYKFGIRGVARWHMVYFKGIAKSR